MGTQVVSEKGIVLRVVFEPTTMHIAHQQKLRYVYLAKISLCKLSNLPQNLFLTKRGQQTLLRLIIWLSADPVVVVSLTPFGQNTFTT